MSGPQKFVAATFPLQIPSESYENFICAGWTISALPGAHKKFSYERAETRFANHLDGGKRSYEIFM